MNEQLTALLNEAKENGHDMLRLSTDLYECSQCSAVIVKKGTDSNWKPSKTGHFCPGARIYITDRGRQLMELHPDLKNLLTVH